MGRNGGIVWLVALWLITGCRSVRQVEVVASPAPAGAPTALWQRMQAALARTGMVHGRVRATRPDGPEALSHLWMHGARWSLFDEDGAPVLASDGVAVRQVVASRAFGAHPVLVRTRHLDRPPPALGQIVPRLVRGEAALELAAVEPVEIQEGGQRFLRVGEIGPTGFGAALWIDPVTALPAREVVGEGTGRMRELTLRYDENPPADWQRPATWKALPEVDRDGFERRWRGKTMAKMTLAGAQVQVHDLQVTRRGDVYLLFTGDLPAPVNTKRLASGRNVRRRFTVDLVAADGERFLGGEPARSLTRSGLRLLFWTPASAGRPWHPRRLRVVFSETWEERGKPRSATQAIGGAYSVPTCEGLPGYLAALGYRPESEAPARADQHLVDWLRRPDVRPDQTTLRAVFADAVVAGDALPAGRWFQLYQALVRGGCLDEGRRALAAAANRERNPAIDAALEREGL